MENKPQNVFDRLDSIETSQAVTQAQNEQIIDLLNKLSDQRPIKQNVEVKPHGREQHVKQNVEVKPQAQVSNQDLLRNFIRRSKKEYVWFGTINEFNKSKTIVNILCVALIIVGILSTILTSVAFNLYTTYTFFENIWLIFACIMFSHSVYAKKRMLDFELREHSNTVFLKDDYGIWRDTNKEKKRFKWFRRISYIAVVCNIICIWSQFKGVIAITVTIFELAFAGITICMSFAYINLFCMYDNFILLTGRNASNTETVTLIFDIMGNKLAPYEEYKEKMKDVL